MLGDPDPPVHAEPVAGLVAGVCTRAARGGPPAARQAVAKTTERRFTAESKTILNIGWKESPPDFDL